MGCTPFTALKAAVPAVTVRPELSALKSRNALFAATRSLTMGKRRLIVEVPTALLAVLLTIALEVMS